MSDNITLPRKHIDHAAHALEHFNKCDSYTSVVLRHVVSEIIHHLRAALDAPEPEPMLMELARQMKPLDSDMAAILHANLDSLYIEDEPAVAPDEIEALRRDAERYRWIRDNHEIKGCAMEIVYGETGSGWDAAIDAAMQEDKT